jgi:hypothetical protein
MHAFTANNPRRYAPPEGSWVASLDATLKPFQPLRRFDAVGRTDIHTLLEVRKAIAFGALVGDDFEKRALVDDGAGRAFGCAIAAGRAFVGIDLHCHDYFLLEK